MNYMEKLRELGAAQSEFGKAEFHPSVINELMFVPGYKQQYGSKIKIINGKPVSWDTRTNKAYDEKTAKKYIEAENKKYIDKFNLKAFFLVLNTAIIIAIKPKTAPKPKKP